MESQRLDGRRALVTGGSKGLGLEMALGLAAVGCEVILVARDQAQLEVAAEQIAKVGPSATIYSSDLADIPNWEVDCERIVSDHGPIQILINNVGNRTQDVPIENTSTEDWNMSMDLNLTSAFVTTRIVGSPMLREGDGKIINIASISGMRVLRGIGGRSYEVAKAALIQFTRTLAADWASRGVRVNAIAPGVILTEPNVRWSEIRPDVIEALSDRIPMGRLGSPEEIRQLAVFLASDASSYITGSVIVMDGGYTAW